MKLYNVILQSATAALSLQNPEVGSMPPGHNGPRYDQETPVRNTSHWLITFLKAYSISNQKQYLEAAQRAAQYLLSEKARPMRATFWHRKNPRKDSCNGLIGQAWTIESLTIAASQLERVELATLARDVFLLHPFNEQTGLWESVGVDGTYLKINMTFNQQLWFAAVGSLLSQYISSEIDQQVRLFMDKLSQNLIVYPSGLIDHLVSLNLFEFRKKLSYLLKQPKSFKSRNALANQAVGYHSFNLYAFALLKQQYPTHHFWNSQKFMKALDYARSKQYWSDIQDNKYGYTYNPTGIEIAFATMVFLKDSYSEQKKLISEQINRCYDFDSNLMNLSSEDPNTQAARLYEATRLPNLEVSVNSSSASAKS